MRQASFVSGAAPRSSRRAFTFVEIVIVCIIAMMLILLVVQAHTRFQSMFVTASSDIALQTDTRVLFDNLSADLVSSILVATGKEPETFEWKADGEGQTLQVFKLKKDPGERHTTGSTKEPPYPGYPGFREDGEMTVQKIPIFRELYETEAGEPVGGKKTLLVFRTEEDGSLTRTEGVPVCGKVPTFAYKFERKSQGRRTRMAMRVVNLNFVPLAFIPIPRPQGPSAPAPSPDPRDFPFEFSVWAKSKNCAQLYHIAGLGVRFVAEDIKPGARGSEGKVEFVCKYWMEERATSFRYNRAFSTLDESLHH